MERTKRKCLLSKSHYFGNRKHHAGVQGYRHIIMKHSHDGIHHIDMHMKPLDEETFNG